MCRKMRAFGAVLVLSAALVLGAAQAPLAAGGADGKALFEQHCKLCHANGGNIMNKAKTLMKKDMVASNLRTADDIVKFMRKPGPGMTPFSEKKIPDHDAKKIAEYILTTFK